nr:alpha/beta fold hydrolase [Alphaproteobacteria bacterium]
GTLLACLLAYLQRRPEQVAKLPLIASASYMVTMIDFSEPGELGVFVDEEQIEALEAQMAEKGYLEASAMAQTFNMLRANDLIWSFVVNNYLLGREPFPFDLLFWNSDATRMPAAMHKFYLRKMYQQNLLAEPDGISLDGTPIDLRLVTTPSFMLATREDHIAPWKSTYAATQLYQGSVKFVLAGSGHIAGVVNPPDANKYSYWTNDNLPPTAEDWQKGAEQHPGSWWTAWMEWLKPYRGSNIPAREPAEPILEDSPGSYVRVRSD